MTPTQQANQERKEKESDNQWNKSLMIIGLEQWVKLKSNEINDNELSTILNTIYNDITFKSNCVSFSSKLLQKLKIYNKDNIIAITKFIDYVLNEFDVDPYNDKSRLTDLYLQLLALKLRILDNNQLAYEKFIPDENIWMKHKQWKQSETAFNNVIPNLMDALCESESFVGSIESANVQTMIEITKHGLSKAPVAYLTVEYKHFKINQ